MREFVEEWKHRYLKGTATYMHLERLKNISKLTDEEFRYIIICKKREGRSVKNG